VSVTQEPAEDSGPPAPAAILSARDLPMLRWVWRDYLRPRRWILLVALTLMAIEGTMLGAFSYIVRPMFDQVFVAGHESAVKWVAAAVAGIFVARGFSAFGHRSIMRSVGVVITTDMQRDMLRHLLTLDSAYFLENSPGTLIERVRGDTTAANAIWAIVLSTAFRDVVSLVALLGVAISVDWRWTVIAVGAAPLLLVPIMSLQRYVRRKVRAARVAAGHLSTRLDEIFHGINTIKLNTAEAHEAHRFDEVVDRYVHQEKRTAVGLSAISLMPDIIAAIGFAGVLVYGGGEIIAGQKTVGEFMSFFTAMGMLFEPLRRVANLSGIWQGARTNLERIQEVFHARPAITSPEPAKPAPAAPGAADIRFEEVVVSYGKESALNSASFIAKAGQTTALVGASGAGKSTVFNSLTRLVDPVSGRILIGGVGTTELTLGDLRALFSVVTQDAPMFDESLRDNIVMTTRGANEERLGAAVETANLADFVGGLAQGLDTPAGPRGSALSGGQRQRVAIARAVLRDAPVLLLDEATSALDAESEARVQAALDRLSTDRTTLVIAHRLSTIRRADKIVVMEAGRVIDEGRHEELLARGGVYARLYRLQFSEE